MIRVTNFEVAEMLRMYKNGATFTQIAEHIGCSFSTVKYHLRPKYRKAMQRLNRNNYRKKNRVPKDKQRPLRP